MPRRWNLARRVPAGCVPLVAAIWLLSLSPAVHADDALGVKTPAGFTATLFADDDLAHDIYSLTIDPRGRVVVAGPGYVKILIDRNGDGQADEAKLFSEFPKSGAKGMLFDHESKSLLVTGDGGLWKLTDANGDDQADGPPELWAKLATPEHGANGLTRGPDGWIYLICGNNAGVDEKLVKTSNSPVKKPKCGAIVRFSPDGKRSEVVADGFRNPYDLTFTSTGEMYTVDSDGEREHCLPWYTPTRLFDVAVGREHGWLLGGWTKSWSRPPWFFDSVEWASTIGRGSPTGLETVRHRAFPERYRNGVFSLCWTFGRLYYFPLERKGSTYFAKPEIFLETVGHVGFAPVDLAVDPAGDLFIAIGGRGTRGGVFRIRADRHGPLEPLDGPLIDQVLQADQPLSSWSRAKWLPIAHALGNKAFEGAAVDPLRPVPERIRAIEILVDVHGGVIAGNFFKAAMNGPPELTARIAWALGCHAANDDAQELLSKLTVYGDAYIQRTAWEAIARCSAWKTQRLHYLRAATDADRRTFFAMLNAIAGLEVNAKPNSGSYLADHAAPELPLPNSPQEQLKQLLGPKPNTWTRWRTDLTEDFGVNDYVYLQKWVDLRRDELNDRRDPAKHLSQAADEARFLKLHENLLAALAQIRMIQILLGDFRAPEDQPEFLAGYSGSTEIISKLTAEQREAIETPLLDMLGRGDRFVNLEVARTLAMIACADAGLPEKLALQLKPSASPQDDFHYLICLAKTTAPRSRIVTMATARTLAELHDKHAAQEEFPRDNHPKHLAALTTLLVERDPALPAALVADPKFGRAEHVIFAQVLPQEARLQAVEELFAAAEVREDGGDEDAWSSELVALAADLPPEVSAGTLRRLCRDPGLRDAAVVSLAKYGLFEDRDLFIDALGSMQTRVVEKAADALSRFDAPPTPDELGGGVLALKRLASAPNTESAQLKLITLLEKTTNAKTSELAQGKPVAGTERAALWIAWLKKEQPEQAVKLLGGSGDWPARLAKIDWSLGNEVRGRAVFERKACHRCHTGATRLGPDLAGAIKRSSREDLFTAIYDPSREVSPTYQTLQIETTGGRLFVGLPVYVSPDGVILQTGPDATVRIVGGEIASQRKSSLSLMPAGLLDGLHDDDLADLAKYLETLAK